MAEPCEYCGAAVANDANACGTCGRSFAREGDRKRAEWAHAAAERDAAWERRPCEFCGAALATGAAACSTCGRPRAWEKPEVAPPPVEAPVRDEREGERKRAEWARAAAERDAAWQQRPCEYCGSTVAIGAAACGTCGCPCVWETPVVAAPPPDPPPVRDEREGDRKRAAWAKAAAERDAAWAQPCEYCGAALTAGATACGTCGRPRASPAPAEATAPRRQTARQFAAVPAGNSPPRVTKPPPVGRARYFIAGVALAIGVVGVVVFTVRRGSAPDAPVPETPTEKIAKAASFEQAIAIARPALVDTTDELGEGASLLASYAAAKLRWSEVAVPAETTLARVEKDPALERGKRLCASGEILRITRRDLGARKIHVGELRTPDAEIAFVAVGTTGDLVKHSRGKLCGAVLGKSGAAVSVLGMFDFEENRRPLVEQ